MKIELRRVSYFARLSQETSAYAADIWIDGKKRGTVENAGQGGPDNIHPRELEDELNAYAKTLPPLTFEEGEEPLEQNAETLLGSLLTRWIAARDLKRMLGRKTVFVRDGALFDIDKRGTPRSPDHVLNDLPFDEALAIFLRLTELSP
jgi:hypothetical protein